MFKKFACISALAGLLALSMAANADTINKSIRIGDGESSDGASSVNGSITVGSGATVTGEVETVNGTIRIGSSAIVGQVSTVNGSLRIGDGVQTQDLETVNGGIRVGGNSTVDGVIEAVNGKISVGTASVINGHVENVNGEIMLDGTLLEGHIGTVNGDITVTNGSTVQGDIIVEKPGGWGFFSNKKKRVPRITIGANSRVVGEIRTEREIKLFVHSSAEIGGVSGEVSMDDMVRFDGDRP